MTDMVQVPRDVFDRLRRAHAHETEYGAGCQYVDTFISECMASVINRTAAAKEAVTQCPACDD